MSSVQTYRRESATASQRPLQVLGMTEVKVLWVRYVTPDQRIATALMLAHVVPSTGKLQFLGYRENLMSEHFGVPEQQLAQNMAEAYPKFVQAAAPTKLPDTDAGRVEIGETP